MKLSRHLTTQFAAIAAIVALATSSSRADSISVTGAFAVDNDVYTQVFSVTAPSSITIESFGYAGGTNAAGATIASGGFDTILTLFRADGAFISRNDDNPSGASDPVTGTAYDSKIVINFALAGTYYATISQYNNVPFGPFSGDPVSRTDSNFTLDYAPVGSSGYFWDANSIERTGNFAFDIVTTTLPVPEPGSLALLGMGGLGLGIAGLVRRRNRR